MYFEIVYLFKNTTHEKNSDNSALFIYSKVSYELYYITVNFLWSTFLFSLLESKTCFFDKCMLKKVSYSKLLITVIYSKLLITVLLIDS